VRDARIVKTVRASRDAEGTMGRMLESWDRLLPIPLWAVAAGLIMAWAFWPRVGDQSTGLARFLVKLAFALGAVYLTAQWLALL
jgi:hypothetical protein